MNLITLTNAATQHIKSMLDKEQHAIGFRLSIKKTGCSGFAYVPSIIDAVTADDIHFMTDDQLAVYIDPSCAEFVKGLVIDYVVDLGAGIKQKRLVFMNPNEKNRCGCGESFTV